MDIGELIWIFIVIFFLYRLFFAPSKQQRQDRYETPSETSYDQSESSTKTRDDILEEMRTIFGGETTTQKPAPKPTPARHRPPPQRSTERAQPAQSKYASYQGTNFEDFRSIGKEAEEALKDIRLKSRALEEETGVQKHSFRYLFEGKELRKGIIISEILSKPKSMRRTNI